MKAILKRLKAWWTKESCYKQMESAGIAAFRMCSGVVGGDKSTEFLAYSCIGCKYWTPVREQTCAGCLYDSVKPCSYTLACGSNRSLYVEKD